jgi:hypothetical protein
MLNKLLYHITLPLFLLACDALKNRTDRIALECGISQSAVNQYSYIKLFSSSGASYESADLLSLKVRLLQDSVEPSL